MEERQGCKPYGNDTGNYYAVIMGNAIPGTVHAACSAGSNQSLLYRFSEKKKAKRSGVTDALAANTASFTIGL